MTDYTLHITPTARRQVAEVLPTAIAFAVTEFVCGPLLAAPHRVGKQLMPPLENHWSARRGTYRILYLINEDTRIVTVVAVSARSDVYRTP